MATISPTPSPQPANAHSALALITGGGRHRATQSGAGFAQAMQREAQGALASVNSAPYKNAAAPPDTRAASAAPAPAPTASSTPAAAPAPGKAPGEATASRQPASGGGESRAEADDGHEGGTLVEQQLLPDAEAGSTAATASGSSMGQASALPTAALHRWRSSAAQAGPAESGLQPHKAALEDMALADGNPLTDASGLAARLCKRVVPANLPPRDALGQIPAPVTPLAIPLVSETDGLATPPLDASIDDKTALDGDANAALLASLMQADAAQKRLLAADAGAGVGAGAGAETQTLQDAAGTASMTATRGGHADQMAASARQSRAVRGDGANEGHATDAMHKPPPTGADGRGDDAVATHAAEPGRRADAAPAVAGSGAAPATGAGQNFAQALAQAGGGKGREASAEALANGNAAATALAAVGAAGLAGNAPAQAATLAGAAATQSLVERRVDVPLGQPGFGHSLGAQVSLLARDGIQQARLHLNPAEMGPITVQIAMEGNTAKVSFVADMAGTRAALEASMPALAGALQEAGLTLTGGGVSQQSTPGGQGNPGHRPQADQTGQTGHADNAEPVLAGRSAPLLASRGLVDLVA